MYNNLKTSSGQCLDKTLTSLSFELYVSPTPTLTDFQLLTGSLALPFQDLDDAITKAYEDCANVIQTCSVTILLMKGDHYLLRSKTRDTYRPSIYEAESQNVQLTIKPYIGYGCTDELKCYTLATEQVTIYNKRRD